MVKICNLILRTLVRILNKITIALNGDYVELVYRNKELDHQLNKIIELVDNEEYFEAHHSIFSFRHNILLVADPIFCNYYERELCYYLAICDINLDIDIWHLNH